MTLTPKHLKEICLLGSSDKKKTCRYLKNDELEEDKWYCQKLQSGIKEKIDRKIIESKSFQQESLIGDNCSGYPLLKHVDQGYDKD